MAERQQAPSTVKTYLDDWTEDLADAAGVLGLSSLTITAADVTVDGGAAIPSSTPIESGVIFRLDTTGVESGNVTAVVHVTLSNGDTDQHSHLVLVRPT